MRHRFIASLALLLAGCSGQTTCGEGTEARFDPGTGNTVCTGKLPQMFVQCDPATASVIGGVCQGDPKKFPSCGDGTMLDPMSNTCVPTMTGTPIPKPCPPQAGKFSVKGVLSHLADGKFATGEMVEVRIYNPLAFLSNPTGTMPQAVQVTGDATYCFDSLVDQSGQGLLAIAVTDPMGPVQWTIAGVGAQGVAPGNTYRVDAYIVEKSLVATWDTQAGLSGTGTFEAKGAYFARFLDMPLAMEANAKPVAGVQLDQGLGLAPNVYYFKGDLMTIDKTAMATDAMTGAVVQLTAGTLTSYSGEGGMVGGMIPNWESFPGASTGGVVFIQKFHPM
jgi:hypothetical protein